MLRVTSGVAPWQPFWLSAESDGIVTVTWTWTVAPPATFWLRLGSLLTDALNQVEEQVATALPPWVMSPPLLFTVACARENCWSAEPLFFTLNVITLDPEPDRKSTRLNSSHSSI